MPTLKRKAQADGAESPKQLPQLLFIHHILNNFVAVDRSSLMRWAKKGQFPKPLKIPGSSKPVWKKGDVEEWVSSLSSQKRG